MAQLNDRSKVIKVTEALGKLATEYANEGDKKSSTVLHDAMVNLPEASKVKLFDLLQL